MSRRKRRPEAVPPPPGAASLGAPPPPLEAPQPSPAGAESAWTRRAPLLAALAAFLLYLPSLGSAFLYDDLRVIEGNRAIRDLGYLETVLRSDPSRPLLALSWALNYRVSGLSPWSYHLVNALLHAGCAALVASLGRFAARRLALASPGAVGLFAGLFFALTPMATETVAYLSSRSSALAGLLSLAALRLALGGLEPLRAGRLAGAGGLLALGLLAKEEAAAAPLLLMACDWFLVARQDRRALRPRLPLYAVLLALPPAGLVLRRALTGAWLPLPAHPPGLYLLTQAAAFPAYLGRALVPFDPAFYRAVPLGTWPPSPGVAVALLVAVGVLVLAFGLRRRVPLLSLAVAWMLLALLPSSLVPLRETVVDHRAYLGGAGAALLAGWFLSSPLRRPAAAFLLLLMAGAAVRYQWILANPVRAWADAVKRAPQDTVALFGLAEGLAERRDPRAEAAYRAAVTAAPGDARTWSNLGKFLADSRRLEEGEKAAREAVRIAPADARVRSNLGLILAMRGKLDEATAEMQAARGLDPPLARVRIALAALLAHRGDREAAYALLDEAASLEIDEKDARDIEALRTRLAR